MYKDLIVTPKFSPAARNRFIYYPDHLVQLPSPDNKISLVENIKRFKKVLEEPLFDNLVAGIFRDLLSPPRHPSDWAKDESIADFIGRRFGPNFAENVVSAGIHGIYAGDIDQLSAQSLAGAIRNLEGGIGGIGGFVSGGVLGSLISRAFSKTRTRSVDDFMAVDAISANAELVKRQHDLETLVTRASTFTFKKGVGQLGEALAASLTASPKVKIHKNMEIKSLSKLRDSSAISVCSSTLPLSFARTDTSHSQIESPSLLDKTKTSRTNFDHVISTIPPVSLAKTMRNSDDPTYQNPGHTPYLLNKQNYAVTAMVVNLYYPDPNLLPVEGFGYLIPRSIPYDQNPECGLGVIFASSSSVGKGPDRFSPEVSQDTAPGTKLTVVMGGHFWDGRQEYPDHDTAVKMARSMLKRHMNITDTPTLARSRLQKDAIPQYTVGHLDRMYDLSNVVRHEFDNRLVLAGNWYNGIGVGDCVKQGILSATYGVGRRKLDGSSNPWRPWTAFDYEDWQLQGGVVMSPVRLVDSSI